MEIVFQKFGALVAAVSVKDPKDLNFRPLCNLGLLGLWLNDIQDNRDPVFIRLPHCAYVRVRRKASY